MAASVDKGLGGRASGAALRAGRLGFATSGVSISRSPASAASLAFGASK
jgi:hypothetical protein